EKVGGVSGYSSVGRMIGRVDDRSPSERVYEKHRRVAGGRLRMPVRCIRAAVGPQGARRLLSRRPERPGNRARGQRGVSSNGPERWNKIVIRRVFPGLRGRNQAVLPRLPSQLEV